MLIRAALLRNLFRRCFTCIAVLAAFVSAADARQGPAQLGSWSSPFDWTTSISPNACGDTDELAHAALIPKGLYAGRVLLWRLERDPVTCNLLFTSETWIFDPNSPAVTSTGSPPNVVVGWTNNPWTQIGFTSGQ